MSKMNFQIARAEPATLMGLKKSESENLIEYKYKDKGRVWVNFSRDGRMNIFSQTGKARQNAFFYCRLFKDISTLDIIRYKGIHYFLSDIQKEERYLKISAVQLEPVLCSHTEVNYGKKDEYNRPVGKMGAVTKFDAFFVEKYIRNELTDAASEVEVAFVAVTDKSIDLKEGALIMVEQNSAGIPAGGYSIAAAHKTNIYHYEYELTRRTDI